MALRGISVSFCNLLTWKYIHDNWHDNRVVYFDSISIYVATRVLTRLNPSVLSGVEFVSRNRGLLSNSLTLSGSEYKTDGKNLVLPFWKDSVDVNKSDIENLDNYIGDIVCIGISSPKQEVLADQLIGNYNTICFCLGAALYNEVTGFARRNNLVWLALLYRDPRRGLNKIYQTLVEIFKLLFSKRRRREFKYFVAKAIQSHNEFIAVLSKFNIGRSN